jgi:dolichol-phosphate mannosyltransferase
MAILLGISMSIVSLINAIWIILKSLSVGFLVSGWASIMVAMFFLFGIILIFMGIIGIYVGEIFRQVKNRPLYIVEKKTND